MIPASHFVGEAPEEEAPEGVGREVQRLRDPLPHAGEVGQTQAGDRSRGGCSIGL